MITGLAFFCQSNESFNHLWTCSVRLPQIMDIIDKAKLKLVNTINTVYTNLSSTHIAALKSILEHETWWLPIYEPIHITFVDFIKGIVPKDLTSLLNDITGSRAASHEIIGITYDEIHSAATKF